MDAQLLPAQTAIVAVGLHRWGVKGAIASRLKLRKAGSILVASKTRLRVSEVRGES